MAEKARSSTYGLNDSLSPTDQELFSLFLQYPEIDFDTDQRQQEQTREPDTTPVPELTSSPLSNLPEEGSNASTLVERHDTSPILITPAKTSVRLNRQDGERQGDPREFMVLIQRSDLPQRCLQYYKLLAQSVTDIGSALLDTSRPHGEPVALRNGSWLLGNVTYSCEQAAAQVQSVHNLKGLTAFNVTPASTQVWSTYLQRANLIAKNLALPSKQELKLIESLIFLFDNRVYNRLLQVLTLNIIDEDTCQVLHDVYDKLMKWLHKYKAWCRGMQDLKDQYMRPLIESFSKWTEAQDEFNDFQERLQKVRSALTRPVDNTAEMTEDMVKKLNLSARRPSAEMNLKRSRTRYKREHTL